MRTLSLVGVDLKSLCVCASVLQVCWYFWPDVDGFGAWVIRGWCICESVRGAVAAWAQFNYNEATQKRQNETSTRWHIPAHTPQTNHLFRGRSHTYPHTVYRETTSSTLHTLLSHRRNVILYTTSVRRQLERCGWEMHLRLLCSAARSISILSAVWVLVWCGVVVACSRL